VSQETVEDILFQQLAYTYSESKQAFARHIGMSQVRLQLLMLLSRQGELSHATLQQQLKIDGATVTRQVKQFEREGIVDRRLDPQDNRYTLVSLTSSGERIVEGLIISHQEFQEKLLVGISKEEQEMLLHTLERLRSNIRQLENEDRE
jgi:DNA-binding MarR family transcriptional regulator